MLTITLPDGNTLDFPKKVSSIDWTVSFNKSNKIYRSLQRYGFSI